MFITLIIMTLYSSSKRNETNMLVARWSPSILALVKRVAVFFVVATLLFVYFNGTCDYTKPASPTEQLVDDNHNDVTNGSIRNDISRSGFDSLVPVGLPSQAIEDLGIIREGFNEIAPSAVGLTSDQGDCNLYKGAWYYDAEGPSYTNNTCPSITRQQNCQGNGRPDKEYENWRWKPDQCELPRFDARKFLQLLSGKKLVFVGDSVARNQMESLMCLLWQVEVPKNRGSRQMHRYHFQSTHTTIARLWSSWLVNATNEPFDYAKDDIKKLHLYLPDERIMKIVPSFDVIILSGGHWFAKPSVYIMNNEIVGGQLWWPDKSLPMKVNNVEAFSVSMETILTSIATYPNFSGLAILRSFSPDHYIGGGWNTGGSCGGKTRPSLPGELVTNNITNLMHDKQVASFERASKKRTNKSKLLLMDITEVFQYRQDGHPGPYRSINKTVVGDGKKARPAPQDCLHWCMPGPVDTWNEFLFEIVRREFEGS